MKVKHYAGILVGDYQFADSLRKEVLSLLKTAANVGHTNVKASLHTQWDWEPNNVHIRNVKGFIREEIEREYKPGKIVGGAREWLKCGNFWANVYEKGDYADSHNHSPYHFSFAYFLKSKWYHPPLVFTESGKRIRPKEGRYVLFPGFLSHKVPKHRYKKSRISLAGNIKLGTGKWPL